MPVFSLSLLLAFGLVGVARLDILFLGVALVVLSGVCSCFLPGSRS